eukprot:scaffold193300_cov27-Attheya_sp.AAC.1
MAEDSNSCHRQGDACRCYCVNVMKRLVIGVAIGTGVCPIALSAGGRSRPDPVAGFLLSPAASGPQSLDGIGGLLSAENDVEVVAWLVPRKLALYAGGSSIPATDILRAWLPCGVF